MTVETRNAGILLLLCLGASACVTDNRARREGGRIVRTHGGTPVAELDPATKASVLAMALGDPSSNRGASSSAPRVSDEAFELFPAEGAMDLDLPRTPLGEALRLLATSSSVNLVLLTELDETVELSLHGVTPREAVRTLVRRYGLNAERDGSVFLIGAVPPDETLGRYFPLHSVSAESVKEAVAALLSEQGSVSLAPSGNALYVRDVHARLGEVETFLAAMDVHERQIAIEVKIYEVGYDDGFGLGFQLGAANLDVGEGTVSILQNLLSGNGEFTTDVVSDNGNLSALMDALQTLTTVDLLSTPRLTAISGREATIEILTRIPYVASTQSVDTSAGATTSVETVQFEEVGIRLKVVPTVQLDDQIRLVVEPEISDAVDFFNGIPVVDSRKVTTEVIVADRGTVFLGGLSQSNVFDSVDKVPLLGDIPYLGALFRRTTQRETKSDLILQITPRLVREGEEEQAVVDQRADEVGETQREAAERRGFWRKADKEKSAGR